MKTFLKENAIIIYTIITIFIMLAFAYGCEPKAQSLIYPNRMVSSGDLEAEFTYLKSQLENRLGSIEQQQKFKNFVLQQGMTFTATGTIDPVGLATSILALLGIGAAADNVRVRKKLKNAGTAKTPENESS